jgi:hypothetical protein
MQPVSNQRLGKHASTIDRLFYAARAATFAMQWYGKHAWKTDRLYFLRGPCWGVILKTTGAAVLWVSR